MVDGLGRLWFNEVVGKGAFAVEADKYALRDVIKGMLAKRQARLRDGNLVWYRTLRAMTSTILADQLRRRGCGAARPRNGSPQ